ncbi:hypothetical protein GCM10020358_72370 [Amorphoplanes nipponensis]|uniref:hypothetical protein n=1 Tax=Actinoplanes nipponensis TaxID=135950 RepID=UPI0031EAD29F
MVGDGEVVLDVPEYVEGTLDWYAFDVGHVSLGLTGQTGVTRLHRLPVPLEFAGMPNNRFWSFEDPGLNFDLLELFHPHRPPAVDGDHDGPGVSRSATATTGARCPLPLPAHAVCQIHVVVITDCFGDTVTAERPAGRWNLFRPDDPQAPDGLGTVFVNAAPTWSSTANRWRRSTSCATSRPTSPWAIETRVPAPLGGSRPPAAPAEPGPSASATTVRAGPSRR